MTLPSTAPSTVRQKEPTRFFNRPLWRDLVVIIGVVGTALGAVTIAGMTEQPDATASVVVPSVGLLAFWFLVIPSLGRWQLRRRAARDDLSRSSLLWVWLRTASAIVAAFVAATVVSYAIDKASHSEPTIDRVAARMTATGESREQALAYFYAEEAESLAFFAPPNDQKWTKESLAARAVEVCGIVRNAGDKPRALADLNIAFRSDPANEEFSADEPIRMFDVVCEDSDTWSSALSLYRARYPRPTTPPTAPPTTVAPSIEVAHFSGSSTKTTPDLALTNPWVLAWAVRDGAGINISVFDSKTGQRIDFVTADPGGDVTAMRFGCTCYLRVDPFGSSYEITVSVLNPDA